MVSFLLHMIIFMCNEEEYNWRRKSVNICIKDKWKFGGSRVLTNKLMMVFRNFFFNSEKLFYMQFGLNKIYSIEEVMMHTWHVLLMPGQRKDSLVGSFLVYGRLQTSNFWEEEKVVKAEGSNSGSPIYGCGPQVGNLHSVFLCHISC